MLVHFNFELYWIPLNLSETSSAKKATMGHVSRQLGGHLFWKTIYRSDYAAFHCRKRLWRTYTTRKGFYRPPCIASLSLKGLYSSNYSFNWDTWKKINQSQHLIFWKRKILSLLLLFFYFNFFFCKWTISIHKFEGCFLRGQEGSNRFIIFNGCIVEPWILLVHLKKRLENLLFAEKHCGKVFLVIKYEGRLPKGAVSRNSAKLGNYKMPVLKSSFRCCLFCIKWHLPLIISFTLDKVGRHLILYN